MSVFKNILNALDPDNIAKRIAGSLFYTEEETRNRYLEENQDVLMESMATYQSQHPDWTPEQVNAAAQDYTVHIAEQREDLVSQFKETGDRGRKL